MTTVSRKIDAKARTVTASAMLLVLLGAAAAWFVIGDREHAERSPSAPAAEQPSTAAAPDAARADAPMAGGAAVTDSTTRVEHPDRAGASVPARNTRTICGRVLNALRAPLAGVRIRLWPGPPPDAGFPVGPATLEPEAASETATDARGRFRIAVPRRGAPGASIVFEHPDRPRLSGYWTATDEEAILDVGDVVMGRGTRVTGRLVDRTGQPVTPPATDQIIRLRPDRQPYPKTAGPDPSVEAAIDADGRFAFSAPIAQGVHDIRVPNIALDGAREVTLRGERAEIQVVVVDPATDRYFRGQVVDTTGAPVRGGIVSAIYDPLGTAVFSNSSLDKDGRFAIRVQRTSNLDPDTRYALQCMSSGYRRLRTERVYRLGDHDIRLTVDRGATLRLEVVRASDGTPLEDYSARITAGPSTSQRSFRGRREDGKLEAVGLEPRRYTVTITPGATTGLLSVTRSLTASSSPIVHTVRIEEPATFSTEISYPNGGPAMGTRVEVFRRADVDASAGSLHSELALADETTDATGRVALSAPPGTDIYLRCTGPHLPLLFGPTTTESNLSLTVQRGARLELRLKPLSVLNTWRTATDPPTVLLTRGAGKNREAFPTANPGRSRGRGRAIPATGDVSLRGVPPGQWNLSIRYRDQAQRRHSETLATRLDLREGGTLSETIDLSRFHTEPVSGRLTIRNAPEAAEIEFWRELPTKRSREAATETTNNQPRRELGARTHSDASGEFATRLGPGTWHATVLVTRLGRPLRLPIADTFSIRSAAPARIAIQAVLAEAIVQVLGAGGQPVAGVQLYATLPGRRWPAAVARSDSSGRVTIQGPVGEYELWAPIRSLNDHTSYSAHYENVATEVGHGAKLLAELAKVERDLGRIQLWPPSPTREVITVQLPTDWYR